MILRELGNRLSFNMHLLRRRNSRKENYMTTITYKENGIVIDGHAENPAACHGISAISQMVANFAEERNWAEVTVDDGHLEISNVKEQYIGHELFRAMFIALGDIAIQYSDCVRVVRE